MEYRISGQIEISSTVDINGGMSDESKKKFKKDIESAFVNAFDNVCDKYKMSQESVHSVFVEWIDLELDNDM